MKYVLSFTISLLLLCTTLCSQPLPSQAPNQARVKAYTRPEIAPKLGNALHLSLSEDGQTYTPLNNNACIFALRKVNNEPGLTPKQHVQGVMKTLTDPWIFRLKDGSFGLVALRTDQNGHTDPAATGAMIFTRSKDLVHYEPEKLCRITTQGALNNITCRYNTRTNRYQISWKGDDGQAYSCETADFNTFSAPAKASHPTYRMDEENTLTLTPEEATYLRNKLGRITNTGIEPLTITLKKGSNPVESLRNRRVTLKYNDGSRAQKRVIWNEEDLRQIDPSRPGTYTVHGEVFQYRFNNPVSISNRADPNALYYNGKYYLVATDEIKWNNITIRCSDKLDGLEDANRSQWKETKILQTPETTHWAPELHVIGGKLSLLLGIGKEAGMQCYIMQLKGGGDPMKPEDWNEPVRVVKQDGTPLRQNSRVDGITLDMTYLEDNGRSYLCWSDRHSQAPVSDGTQSDTGPVLRIATINPAEPCRLTSPVSVIGDEAYSWSFCRTPLPLSEGPFVVPGTRDKIYMVYSGGGVTGGNYAVGMLIADKGTDLLNPESWYNSNYPWMNNGSPVSLTGAGHNSFVVDEFGSVYNVYHSGHRPRHTSFCVVHYRFDGSPVIDMAAEEEVAPPFRKVIMQIKIH